MRADYMTFYLTTTTVASIQYQYNRSQLFLDATPVISMPDGFNYHDPDQLSIAKEDFFYEEPFCPYKCELTNDRGYVVYSALGSFYIPMLVMLFFYWRIYKAAVRTTRAIKQGFKTTKGTLIIYLKFMHLPNPFSFVNSILVTNRTTTVKHINNADLKL